MTVSELEDHLRQGFHSCIADDAVRDLISDLRIAVSTLKDIAENAYDTSSECAQDALDQLKLRP